MFKIMGTQSPQLTDSPDITFIGKNPYTENKIRNLCESS